MAWPGGVAWGLPPLALWGFVLSFFRDPERRPPGGEETLVSPADGVVTEVAELPEGDSPAFVGGRATKVGIFLSVFDVHVNRAPCAGRVALLQHADGGYLNALDPASAAVNERQDMGLLDEARGRKVLVRQIAGAIARHIVCEPKEGQDLARGQRYGMIKFGSRTELFIPSGRLEVRVRVGQRVRGGESVLGVWI